MVDESRNGAPRHSRGLLHLPLEVGQGGAEEQLAALVAAIIEADSEAQVIAFHDSRQGIERVAKLIGRDDVLPYRSGYSPEDRRRIEQKLQRNEIRGVIATSALELGIDMPDLNYGVNLWLPQSRKQLLQRIGRVGRSRPGTFVLLASDTVFAEHGESLETYFQEAVEPSNLYLDNEYIAFQQALRMVSEMRAQETDAMSPPTQCAWSAGFAEALRNAHVRAPMHLDDVLHRTARVEPHLAYGLRNSGEEKLGIYEAAPDSRARGERIEEIDVSVAMREAYPGAVYHHQGQTYTVRQWGRDRETRTAHINVVPAKDLGSARTKPISRRVVTTGTGREHVVDRRRNVRRRGEIAQTKLVDPDVDPGGREVPLLPEVGGPGRHKHRGGQRIRADSQRVSLVDQLGAGLRQRPWRAGSYRSPGGTWRSMRSSCSGGLPQNAGDGPGSPSSLRMPASWLGG